MQYLKGNTKYSILAFLIIVLSITISISTLAKTEVYLSLSDNPQKVIIKNINKAEIFIDVAMYTWTSSARTRNDENLLVIDDEEVIIRFQKQFENLWKKNIVSKELKNYIVKLI